MKSNSFQALTWKIYFFSKYPLIVGFFFTPHFIFISRSPAATGQSNRMGQWAGWVNWPDWPSDRIGQVRISDPTRLVGDCSGRLVGELRKRWHTLWKRWHAFQEPCNVFQKRWHAFPEPLNAFLRVFQALRTPWRWGSRAGTSSSCAATTTAFPRWS